MEITVLNLAIKFSRGVFVVRAPSMHRRVIGTILFGRKFGAWMFQKRLRAFFGSVEETTEHALLQCPWTR
ncbi:hypothetical protein PIB30_066560 [Stylosanthes scabra]|uniref:Uncharacterized protein n=1 Tax=Stylosanthes scabra TaxID=79078 RepID=A0ABU6ZL45_9FABA|nr:hypothetical protein [Stylosanthes scabra]